MPRCYDLAGPVNTTATGSIAIALLIRREADINRSAAEGEGRKFSCTLHTIVYDCVAVSGNGGVQLVKLQLNGGLHIFFSHGKHLFLRWQIRYRG